MTRVSVDFPLPGSERAAFAVPAPSIGPGYWAGASTAISTVTTVGYLGFLLGPLGLGLAASATTLATALLMVAALALGLAVLARLLSRSTPARSSPWRCPS